MLRIAVGGLAMGRAEQDDERGSEHSTYGIFPPLL